MLRTHAGGRGGDIEELASPVSRNCAGMLPGAESLGGRTFTTRGHTSRTRKIATFSPFRGNTFGNTNLPAPEKEQGRQPQTGAGGRRPLCVHSLELDQVYSLSWWCRSFRSLTRTHTHTHTLALTHSLSYTHISVFSSRRRHCAPCLRFCGGSSRCGCSRWTMIRLQVRLGQLCAKLYSIWPLRIIMCRLFFSHLL